MRYYDDFAIVAVFIKRKKLFFISLCVCLILGAFWVQSQIKAIKQERALYHDSQSSTQEKALQYGFIQYNRTKQIQIADKVIQDTLAQFAQEDKITDFRSHLATPFFSIYVVFYTHDNPLPAIIQALESHPVTQEVKSTLAALLPAFKDKEQAAYAKMLISNGFFKIADIPHYIEDPSQRPINKHYIHLDKERLSQKGYSITSTEIIKHHQSLNSNKIWVFMIVCSIMISVFIIFGVENFANLRQRLKQAKVLQPHRNS